MALYNKMARDDAETLDFLKKELGEQVISKKNLILFGSETGNAEQVANQLSYEMTRRGERAEVVAMNDFDL